MQRRAFDEAQTAVLNRYSVSAEDRYPDAPMVDGRAHVLVAGAGPPVLLLNGIGVPAAMLAPLMSGLKGHTLYAVDLPGYGLTDTTAALSDDLRTNAVTFLEDLLDALGLQRPAFVANSLGSLWATWLAIDRPDRVAALVHVGWPAIILGTSAPLPMRLLSVRGLGRLMMTIQRPSPRQVRQLARMVEEHPLPAEIAELLLATERLPGFGRTFRATLHRLLRLRGARPALALTAAQLAHVQQPTLLILGADDPMASVVDGERFAAAQPNASTRIVTGGHAPWLDDTDQIATLVNEFLHRAGISYPSPSGDPVQQHQEPGRTA